jgi:hypothetical protein
MYDGTVISVPHPTVPQLQNNIHVFFHNSGSPVRLRRDPKPYRGFCRSRPWSLGLKLVPGASGNLSVMGKIWLKQVRFKQGKVTLNGTICHIEHKIPKDGSAVAPARGGRKYSFYILYNGLRVEQ